MGVLEQNYNTAMEKPLRVLEIFNEFFGEDRVDMQGFPTLADVQSVLSDSNSLEDVKAYIIRQTRQGFILVHFPHVRVTNEYDKFVDIKHLYAKVVIDIDGKIIGRFSLNRSEYTVLHFSNNYMHSHILSIPNVASEFQMPCTGSGPINNTICSLSRDFDEDLWRLFCLELDRFTQVESISGTPYHRLESLIKGGRGGAYRVYDTIRLRGTFNRYALGARGLHMAIKVPQLAEFIKYVIDSNILKFVYQNGSYYLAMSPCEFYIKISNLFIDWYNKKYKAGEVTEDLPTLCATGMLNSVKYVNNCLMKDGTAIRDYRTYQGARVCTFKGQDVRIVISDAADESVDTNNVLIIKQDLAEYIITKILNVINFRYGNNEQQNASTAGERVFYV